MASSSRPTGTQYATVPHDPCPIQYLGDYMRSPFFVVSFFVTSPLWYLPPAAFTQGSGPEAVAGPSRNLMPNVGNWHGVVPIQQPPSINVQVGQGAAADGQLASLLQAPWHKQGRRLLVSFLSDFVMKTIYHFFCRLPFHRLASFFQVASSSGSGSENSYQRSHCTWAASLLARKVWFYFWLLFLCLHYQPHFNIFLHLLARHRCLPICHNYHNLLEWWAELPHHSLQCLQPQQA